MPEHMRELVSIAYIVVGNLTAWVVVRDEHAWIKRADTREEACLWAIAQGYRLS